jgi:uncharacterized repeat protein (TIGR01451 family)
MTMKKKHLKVTIWIITIAITLLLLPWAFITASASLAPVRESDPPQPLGPLSPEWPDVTLLHSDEGGPPVRDVPQAPAPEICSSCSTVESVLEDELGAPLAAPALPEAAYVYTDTTGLMNINSYDCGSPAVLTLDVGDAFTVGDVDVGINLNHEHRGDVFILLQSPDGTIVELIEDPGVEDPSDNYDVRVDDVSPNPRDDGDDDNPAYPYYERTIAPVTNYLNTGGLNAFEGEAAEGVWRLRVCDQNTGSNDGDLRRWTLFFREPAPEFDRLGIKGAPYRVEPGDIVTYALYLRNTGSLTASHLLISDSLPSGVAQRAPATFEPSSGATSILSSATDPITWYGSIPPGEMLVVYIPVDVTASAPTMITNTAVISGPALVADAAQVGQIAMSAASRVYPAGALYYYYGINLWTGSANDRTAAGSWTIGGDWLYFPIPVPIIGPPTAHSGVLAFGTNLGGAYSDDATSTMTGILDLTGIPSERAVTLQWWEWLDMAANDEAYVEIASTGYPTPTLLYGQHSGGLTTEQEAHESRWFEVERDITRYRGQVITLTFTLQPNGNGSAAAGWYIDDIGIHTAPGRPNFEQSRKVATPSVVGAGQDLTYTLYIHNSGSVASTDGYLFDQLPEGLTVEDASLSGPGNLATGDTWLEWRSTASAPLPSDQTAIATVKTSMPWDMQCGSLITNTASITDEQALGGTVIEAPLFVYGYGEVVEYWDLEADDGGLVSGSTGEWEWGAPDPTYPLGPRHAHSGERVWGTDLDADARGTGDDHILNLTLALPDDPKGLYLRWWDWFDEDNSDGRRIWVDSIPIWQDTTAQPYWAPQVVELSEWAGETVDLAFDLSTCCGDPGPAGWYIDDISLHADCPHLALAPEQDGHICPGNGVTYPLTIKNATEGDQIVALSVDGDWPAEVVPPELFLDPGESAALTATVQAPWTAVVGTCSDLILQARTHNGWYTDALQIETVADLGSSWDGLADTPQGTRLHGLAYHDGYLYQIGGETALWTPTDAVYRYDIAGDSWSARAALPVDVSGVDAVTLGDHIYVPGGSDDAEQPFYGGTFLDTLHIYDPATNAWSTGAALSAPLAFASAVALDGKLYVVGGQLDDGRYSDALYVYDPIGDSWSQGASMGEARAYAGAGVIDGQIYVAGGYAGGDVNHNSLEIYDPDTDTWRQGADLPSRVAAHAVSVVDDRYLILIGGGEMSMGTYRCSSDTWAFDSVTEHWFPLPDLNRCMYGTKVIGNGGNLYLVSGRTNEGGWHMATEVEQLTRCEAPPDLGWSKDVAGDAWSPDFSRTIYARDLLTVTDVIESSEAFNLDERWDPDHLTLMTYTITPPGTGQVVPGGAWRIESEAPFAYSRGDAEYSEVTGLVYFLGGRRSDGNDYPRIWAFDPQTGVYTDTGVDMPSAVTNYVIARLTDGDGREILVTFGGYLESSGGFTDLVQGFYPDDNTTAVFATDPLPVASIPGGVAVVDNKAYVFSGSDGSVLLDDTHILDPTAAPGNRWSAGPTLNHARRYIPSAVVDGVIYAMGGTVPNGGGMYAITVTERLDTSAGSPTWDEAGVAPMPIACDEAPAFGFDPGAAHELAGSVVIAGCGHWPDESGLALRYDAVHNRWDMGFPGLNQARRNHAGALVSSDDGVPGMWVWGGRYLYDGNVLSTPEHYVLSELNWTVPSGTTGAVTFTKSLVVADRDWEATDIQETVWVQERVLENRSVSLVKGDRSFIYLPLVMRDTV